MRVTVDTLLRIRERFAATRACSLLCGVVVAAGAAPDEQPVVLALLAGRDVDAGRVQDHEAGTGRAAL